MQQCRQQQEPTEASPAFAPNRSRNPRRLRRGGCQVPQVGIINPGEFSPLNSIELVIWVAVGGRGTLYGAIVGALLINYAKTVFTGVLPDEWLYALGALFVLVTLFLPKGVMGLLNRKEIQA